jgi:class 3 adenylate cyclase
VIPLTVREAPQGSTWGTEVLQLPGLELGIAQPGEVLVSGAVRDLVAGSGIEFGDRGQHPLKGIAGRWHLYAVRSA